MIPVISRVDSGSVVCSLVTVLSKMILWGFLPLLVLTKPTLPRGVGGGRGVYGDCPVFRGSSHLVLSCLGCLPGGCGQLFCAGGRETVALLSHVAHVIQTLGVARGSSGLQKAPLEPDPPCLPLALILQATWVYVSLNYLLYGEHASSFHWRIWTH